MAEKSAEVEGSIHYEITKSKIYTGKMKWTLENFKETDYNFIKIEIPGLKDTYWHLTFQGNTMFFSTCYKYVHKSLKPYFRFSISTALGNVRWDLPFTPFEINVKKMKIGAIQNVLKRKDNFLPKFQGACMIGESLTLNVSCWIKEIDSSNSGEKLQIEDENKFTNDIQKIFNDDEISKSADCLLMVQERVFKVHKNILMARSPVFHRMLSENFQEGQKSEVIIANASPECFEEFLRFIFTGEVNSLDEFGIELLCLSDMYDVPDLKQFCETAILFNLTEENSADVYQYAHLYNCNDLLKQSAFEVIRTFLARRGLVLPDTTTNDPKVINELIASVADTPPITKATARTQVLTPGTSQKWVPTKKHKMEPKKKRAKKSKPSKSQ